MAALAALLLGSPAFSTGPSSRPVVIDAGHGGRDLGAVRKGIREKDIALAVANRLKEALEADGAGEGLLLRDSDDYIPLDERVSRSLATRGSGFVSLHVNEVRSKTMRGITIYVYGNERCARARATRRKRRLAPLPAPSRQAVAASTKLALALMRSLRGAGLEEVRLDRSRYYVLKNPKLPSVLVELGYLSNPEEAALLKDPEYQDRLARSLARGLLDYEESARKAEKGEQVSVGK